MSSTFRTDFFKTSATAKRAVSPAAWPKVSLVALKSSRYISGKIAGSLYRWPRAMARSSASENPRRFRRPVFLSVMVNVRSRSI